MATEAYFTSGGRVIYTSPQEAEKYIQRGSYIKATPDQILFDNIRKGRIPQGFQRVHFPFWDGVNPIFGYGTVAYNLIKSAMQAECVLDPGEHQGQKIALIYKVAAQHYRGDKTFSHLKTYYNRFRDKDRPKIMAYTMWETSRVPELHIEYINKYADVLLVPTKWQVELYKKNGVKKPIEILGHGIDEDFTFVERPLNFETFNFLHYNAGEIRKGYLDVIEAFNREFKKGEKVKLTLKTTNRPADLFDALDKVKNQIKNEIKVECKTTTKAELAALCGQSHCFVFPSKGEGFGLTPLEAMATGLPAIIPKEHGFKDFWNGLCYEVETKLSPATYGAEYYTNPQDMGQWYDCSIPSIQKQMRLIFENWQKLQKHNKKVALEIKKEFTWAKVAQDLSIIIKKYA